MTSANRAAGAKDIFGAAAWRAAVRLPPSIAEWEDASCGSFTDQEDETMSLLDGKKHDRTLAQSEALLFNLLLEKRTKKDQCETALIYRHLQRLPPP